MSLMRRVIACLDVRDGRVVKGTRFVALRDVGDPVELAARYEAEGADEVMFLDIGATPEARATRLKTAERAATRLSIPLTIGGGIRSVADMADALRAGADKVSVNSAAVLRPALITECSAQFGAQCVVASIDVARSGAGARGARHVFVGGGRIATRLDAVAWARECVARGAGEILLTSIDRDGVRDGFDLELTRAVSDAVNVPVIASGGAGSASHVCEVLGRGGADAALVAGILHDGVTTVREIKAAMRAATLPVREVAA
ncbi:MAG TPA: imidazole glycerol phosphate synthase subunit HisF [Gemmatimonadaceae bacterium]|nr:imidazole glycerol phosphate synthase subunit HisF [Gemmatimonadaceae bacterium]